MTGRVSSEREGAEFEESAMASMFLQFCDEHMKVYDTEEKRTHRYNVFKNNLKQIRNRNEQEQKNGGTALHGVNMFSDLTSEEFSDQYLGNMQRKADQHHPSDVMHVRSEQLDKAAYIPVEIMDLNGNRQLSQSAAFGVRDWSSMYTTPVKNQGTCGSCYAHVATQQLESDAIRLNLLDKNSPLSVQELVACNTNYPTGGGGCNGGNAQMALSWVGENGGMMYEADYPYESADGTSPTCSFEPQSPDAMITLSGTTDIDGEAAMAIHVMNVGPLGTGFYDANLIQSYTSGVFAGCTSKTSTAYGHAVQITGVNLDANPPYWIIRNTWSTRWGMDGYFYMKYGVNMCGLKDGFYSAPLLANSKAPTFTPTKNPNPAMNTHIPTAQPTPSAAPTARYCFDALPEVTYNGQSTKVEFNDGLGFSLGNTFTVAAWVTTTSTAGTQVLVSIGSTPGAWGGFDVVLTGGGAVGIMDSCSNGVMTYVPGVSVATGVRTHIALVKKGANYNIFINGKSYKFTVAAGDCPHYNTATVYLGWDAAINCWYNGKMDNVHICNTILRQEYIQGLIETETPVLVSSPTPMPTSASDGVYYTFFTASTQFDGTKTVPTHGVVTFPFSLTDKFSITLWFSASSIINNTPDFLGMVQIDNFVLLLKDKKVGILENCAGSLGIVGYPLNANQQYFVAVSKIGRTYKFCYNGGVLCGALTMGMDCTYANHGAVGEGDARLRSISQNSHFVGTMSKVKVHNEALTQTQIQAIKDQGP
eukprot:CAMPEP_0182439192 /NCGR_PEP_ID=MMETSP1167-20130531/86286_1 /TAXON_ID=2988 /ORGANISM="Mallomonas Sp, Strain CCMP3275" /LENGTH=757 /DNA_ID=CAMNT_0024632835 /DNA_START=642 /DNA_END=2915 /DNA_ORIENTATION=+